MQGVTHQWCKVSAAVAPWWWDVKMLLLDFKEDF